MERARSFHYAVRPGGACAPRKRTYPTANADRPGHFVSAAQSPAAAPPPGLRPSSACLVNPLVHIDRERCLQLDFALACEWLETDRLGGYASSTVLLCNQRRYHGLLVTAPPGF